MINKYYDSDCNFAMLDGKTVAILGFGIQGHAHAMNLQESGAKVVVGAYSQGRSRRLKGHGDRRGRRGRRHRDDADAGRAAGADL